MSALLSNLPLLIFGFIIFSIVRAIRRAQELSQKHQANQSETDEQRRAREIQERIRRIVAERRGKTAGAAPTLSTSVGQAMEDPRRGASVPPTDFFGGPVRRVFQELDRKITPPAEAPGPARSDGAELERQQRLADELRNLQDIRALVDRRAQNAAVAAADVRASAPALRARAREELLADLQAPSSLRRAFVLREVLGPPVGMR